MNNMLRLLLYMHHIALWTPCIVHFNLNSYLCIYARSCGAEIGSSNGASPGASHPILDFPFGLILLC
jgi:hypothetical protein